ncbi:MAG TPA: RimK family alpha-L-glutamate ligase [Candidatus Acidoferrales bacterium]|nr:RimK family alpha-L-glutamate ligase [Candidatus Acidoferrales bacterium]
MSRIACFVEKYNFTDPREEGALQNFKKAAEDSGNQFSFLFRENIADIPNYDAVFIRATTDPLFTAYIVSKTAYEYGLRVIDDPESIKICANKIHQYELFEKHDVPRIPTMFLSKDDLHHKKITEIFDTLGKPVVIKAPYTSFSRYVEKAACETSFREVSKRFFKKSDVLAIQKFTPTSFDWRVGVLGNEVLYVCKYMIPKGKWKHGAKLRGKPTVIWGRTVAVAQKDIPSRLREVALKACSVVGKGLYGVDLKEVNGDYVVVEINDNPSIYAGYEDQMAPDIYKRIINYLSN